MLLLIGLAFLAGIVTILSPCIFPVLPVVLVGSVGESKRQPLGIILGFVGSFTFFTLSLTFLTRALGIPAEWWRWFAAGVMVVFGLTMILSRLKGIFVQLIRVPAGVGQNIRTEGGFLPGLLLGASLGLVWTPCVGPILATVLSLSLVGQVGTESFLVMSAYAIGTSLPMLLIIYGGRSFLERQIWLKKNLLRIEKGFGVLVVMTGLAILMGWDRSLQIWALRVFPGWGAGLTRFEFSPVIDENLGRLRDITLDVEYGRPSFELQSELMDRAPDFLDGGPWLNSEPLSLSSNLKGKVVMVDFWTYSCINCIRTIPYLRDWYEKFKDKGFVLVGVHSPEFEFEKDPENVREAIAELNIPYPVVLDNQFMIWNAYRNHYWPAHYLIDREGRIVYQHFGEGKYAETEREIATALGMSAMVTDEPPVPIRAGQTPEIYLGYERAANYEQNIREGNTAAYELVTSPDQDMISLGGRWRSEGEYIESAEDSAVLELNFRANKVYLVMSRSEGIESAKVLVSIDGKESGLLTVGEADKYDVADLGKTFERHILRLRADKGVRMFAFTFGTE